MRLLVVGLQNMPVAIARIAYHPSGKTPSLRKAVVMIRGMRSGIGFAVALGFAGCSGGPMTSSLGPSAPSVVSVVLPIPTITAISVNVGSTEGGTPIRITGTNLQRGASVTFGEVKVTSNSWDPRDAPGTSLLITTPAHAAGQVDVIVTNPDRSSVRVSQGYEYAPQQAFDFNGRWDGVSIDGQHTMIQFTIANNVLVTASCQGLGNTVVSLSTGATNGDFSSEGPDGFRVSGRIVSASDATGRLTAPACGSDTTWWASKLGR